MDGWIILHRKITKWEWYKDINTKTVFLHLLLTANIKPAKYKGFLVNRGELITSLTDLAEKTGLSKTRVRTALEHLKSTGEITDKTTNKFRVITITNYAEYQNKQTSRGRQGDRQQEADKRADDRQRAADKHSGDTQIARLEEQEEQEEQKEQEEQEEQINKERESDVCRIVISMFNELCEDLPRCEGMSERRKKAIEARLKKYSAEELKRAFLLAEASDFLKGDNPRGWTADFDWLIKDENLQKVLNGNYKNFEGQAKKNAFTSYSQRTYDFEAYEKEERARLKKYLEEG